MNYINRLLIILFVLNIIHTNSNAQFLNNNAIVKISSNAYIKGQNVDFINKSDGTVDNDGVINLKGGNWVNNSNNDVFTNQNHSGEVALTGNDEQTIGGSRRTQFESLSVSKGTKKLLINETEILDKFTLTDNAVMKLNLYRLIIHNGNSDAVEADDKSYILSENIDNNYNEDTHNDNVYGELQWNISTNKGVYVVPFGDNNGSKLNLTVNVKSSGSPDWGNFVFATYPTNSLNYPLPSTVNSIDGINPADMADRFWKIKAVYDSKPNVNLKFGFADNDIAQERNPGLSAENLIAVRYNPYANSWLSNDAAGSYDANEQAVSVPDVNANNLFEWWTLISRSKLETSNYFTPNNDGHNDLFIPEFNKDKTEKYAVGLVNIEGKIFNRWGNKIYEWTGENWWDGKYKGSDVPEGTYFYIITAKGIDGVEYNKKGSVALIRKK